MSQIQIQISFRILYISGWSAPDTFFYRDPVNLKPDPGHLIPHSGISGRSDPDTFLSGSGQPHPGSGISGRSDPDTFLSGSGQSAAGSRLSGWSDPDTFFTGIRSF